MSPGAAVGGVSRTLALVGVLVLAVAALSYRLWKLRQVGGTAAILRDYFASLPGAAPGAGPCTGSDPSAGMGSSLSP